MLGANTKNGLYTVRSAYVEEWKKQHGRKLEYSDGMGRSKVNPIWGKIWKLACPAKVKIFIWRTLHGTLPCRVTLANRHIKTQPICPACLDGPEDRKHVLFLCQKAKEVWEYLGLYEVVKKPASLTVQERQSLNSYSLCLIMNYLSWAPGMQGN